MSDAGNWQILASFLSVVLVVCLAIVLIDGGRV